MTHILTFTLVQPSAGEDEGEEQAGAAPAGHHQGVCDEGGREDQGGDPGVEPDQHQALGRLPKELYSGGPPVCLSMEMFLNQIVRVIFIQ